MITQNLPERPAVYAPQEACRETAAQLAAHLQTALLTEETEAAQAGLLLRLDETGLTLTDGSQTMQGDFTRLLPRLRRANLQQEFLVKAAKIRNADHPLTAVDATAGMGEDSLLLAAAGFQVRLYEYDPVIAALLRDTLRRAAENPELREIVSRMDLREEDSITALQQLNFTPDVVVLDPMFPERQKSALVKKKFQLLHQLERPCSEETELLTAAMAAHPKRIVVKRPLKGPFLAGVKPSYSLNGKAIRYDCIVPPQGGNGDGPR